MTITVALVEDHPIVRQGVRAMLDSQPEIAIVVEEGAGGPALDAIERIKPDVILLDLALPDIPGLEVLRRARQLSPASRVLIVSMHAGEAYVVEALRDGATGFVSKSAEGLEFVRAVRDTAEGRRYFSPPIDESVLNAYLSRVGQELDLYETLTPREKEVLALACESLNNTQIGERLAISPRTVETHRFSVMRKLGLRTQTDLVRFALKRGILPPE